MALMAFVLFSNEPKMKLRSVPEPEPAPEVCGLFLVVESLCGVFDTEETLSS